jgi:hypothetical protein
MNTTTRERAWHFKQLRWSLQALAASASDQQPLFPEGAPTADELALDFDHWASLVRDRYGTELDAGQTAALEAIDQVFSRMSRDAIELEADIWSEAAVRTTEDWAVIRRLAAEAIDSFGWNYA